MTRSFQLLSVLVTAVAIAACSEQTQVPSSPTSLGTALSSTGSAAASSKPNQNISVTTTFNDVDAAGLSTDISSDGQGSYPDGVNGVVSILTANGYDGIKWGDWQFDALSSPTRRVRYSFDADDAILPGDPHYTAPANPPYWGTAAQLARIEVKCTLLNKNMLTMAAGASFTCPMAGHLFINGIQYGFIPGASATGYPETTDAQIVCNAADSGGCNDWFIEPIGSVPAVARLVRHDTVHGKDVRTNEGDFYIRLLIHVTRP